MVFLQKKFLYPKLCLVYCFTKCKNNVECHPHFEILFVKVSVAEISDCKLHMSIPLDQRLGLVCELFV
jgi:hypothetical protein